MNLCLLSCRCYDRKHRKEGYKVYFEKTHHIHNNLLAEWSSRFVFLCVYSWQSSGQVLLSNLIFIMHLTLSKKLLVETITSPI